MIEAAEASGELEPGRELLEPTSGNTGISLALVAKLKGYPLTCVMPENATEERKRLLRLYGANIVYSPGERGLERRRPARARARRARRRATSCRSSTRTRRTRARTTKAPARRSPRRSTASTSLVAGLGTGGTLMGTGERLRETFPDIVVAAARAASGRSGDGAALARRRLRPADPRRLEARPQGARLERGVGARGCVACSTRTASSPASPAGAVGHVARKLADELDEGVVVAILADAGWKYLSADFWETDDVERGDGANRLVVIPAEVRDALVAHAEREAPNEACGLVVLRDGRAERYEPGRNAACVAVPLRARVRRSRDRGSLEDEGYELAVFHSHISSPARPSRTDVENIGLWAGKPYLVYSIRHDDLAAFRIEDGQIEEVPVTR